MTEHGYNNYREEDEWPSESPLSESPPEALTEDEQAVVDALEKARPRFEHLTEELAQDYPHKKWDIIIGDDASGRLPALFVGNIVNRWRTDDGDPRTTRVFIGGGRVDDESFYHSDKMGFPPQLPLERYEEVQEEVAEKEAVIGETIDTFLPGAGERQERALIVTDHIEFGHTVARIARALEDRNIACDVAAFNTDADPDIIEGRLRASGELTTPFSLYVGEAETPDDITFKPEPPSARTEALRRSYGVVRPETGVGVLPDPEADPQLMRVARQKVAEIAQDCYDQYPVADEVGVDELSETNSYDQYRQQDSPADPDHPDRAVTLTSQDRW